MSLDQDRPPSLAPLAPTHEYRHEYVRVLSIAGSDSSGGAGVQADLKTFAALGCYGMSAITALTAQNTRGVDAIHVVPPAILRQQIDAVVQDLGAHAVKIGMLHNSDTVAVVAQALADHQLPHVVLDPVMLASSGAALMDSAAMQAVVQKLFPLAELVTPNLDEAACLVQAPLHSEKDMPNAAHELIAQGARAVLIKGGHLKSDTVSDFWMTQNGEMGWLRAPRISSQNTHGTGCTLSSAIAAHLALGHALAQAIEHAHAYVRLALQAGTAVRTGAGNGPLNHGAAPQAMQLRPLSPVHSVRNWPS